MKYVHFYTDGMTFLVQTEKSIGGYDVFYNQKGTDKKVDDVNLGTPIKHSQ